MNVEVFTQQGDGASLALVEAAASMLAEIRESMDLRTPDQLPAGECAVKVCGEWFGFAGLDSRGRMVLWADGFNDPFFFGPGEGETFAWRLLIGGIDG